MVEKPSIEEAPSNFTIMGRYILDSKIFDDLAVAKMNPKIGEIDMTAGIVAQINKGGVVAHNFEGKRYDMGSRIGFLKANIEAALRMPDMKDQILDLIESFEETTREMRINVKG